LKGEGECGNPATGFGAVTSTDCCAGYTVIPAVILDRQQALLLDPVDVNILLQLLTHWWKADNLPCPSKKLFAERIGKTAKTVQRRIAKQEHAGYVKRVALQRSEGPAQQLLRLLRPHRRRDAFRDRSRRTEG
jgi:hypothetical protein